MMLETGVLVIGLTQCLKMAGVPKKWLPLVAVLFGTLLTVLPFIGSPYQVILTAVMEGILIGLTSSGMVGVVDDRLTKLSKETPKI